MKEKQFDPARHNETSPASGMAAVNTHNPGEKEPSNIPPHQVMNQEEMKRVETDQAQMPNAMDEE